MTREDAIYWIKNLAVLSTEKNMPQIEEALNMAIEALADRKTEPTISKMEQVDEPQINEADEYWLSLLKDVVDGKMSDAGANQAWYEYINHKDEPQTERSE